MGLEKALETNKARAKRYLTEYKKCLREIKDQERTIDEAEREYRNARDIAHLTPGDRGDLPKYMQEKDAVKRTQRNAHEKKDRAQRERRRLATRARYLYRWLVEHGARPTKRTS